LTKLRELQPPFNRKKGKKSFEYCSSATTETTTAATTTAAATTAST